MPVLKDFLKNGHAERYHNVEIRYISGKSPTLTIYRSGEMEETLSLKDFKSKEELHELFQSKGFVLKPEEEINVMNSNRRSTLMAEMREDRKRRLEEQRRHIQKVIEEERQQHNLPPSVETEL